MIKSLVLCSVAIFAIFSARCQTSPTRINSTSQPRDNRTVVNKSQENHSEANQKSENAEMPNRNSAVNAEAKPVSETNPTLSNSAANKK